MGKQTVWMRLLTVPSLTRNSALCDIGSPSVVLLPYSKCAAFFNMRERRVRLTEGNVAKLEALLFVVGKAPGLAFPIRVPAMVALEASLREVLSCKFVWMWSLAAPILTHSTRSSYVSRASIVCLTEFKGTACLVPLKWIRLIRTVIDKAVLPFRRIFIHEAPSYSTSRKSQKEKLVRVKSNGSAKGEGQPSDTHVVSRSLPGLRQKFSSIPHSSS